tara:strand:+ start:96 stop:998 length:903 start_codon:yes stop_codon:yes gene_type:complete
MSISFVITTFNSEQNIENCLRSINFQSDNDTEIIIVDNNSSDKTLEISRKFTKNIFTQGPERSAQRNYGIEKTKNNHIVFLDSDMILSPFFIESLLNIIKLENPLALYVQEEIIISNFFTKIRNHERYFYTATPIDCVRFINKNFFYQIGKFDESLTGPEDWDLNNRVLQKYSPQLLKTHISKKKLLILSDDEFSFYKKNGIDLNLLKNPCVFHDERDINIISYIVKKSYYSQSFEKYIHKWGRNNYFVKKQLGFFYRFIFVFIEKGKYKKFLKKIHLSFMVYFLKSTIYLKYLLSLIKL